LLTQRTKFDRRKWAIVFKQRSLGLPVIAD